jgi:hypothetical protein
VKKNGKELQNQYWYITSGMLCRTYRSTIVRRNCWIWSTGKLTYIVIPFSNFLCWVNYDRGGILFCDVSEEMPKLVYLRLPITDRPRDTSARPFFDTKRSVCITEAGLKFVDVSREDGELSGPMEPGTGFTIACHTLKISESGDMKWDKDFSITSKDLWACNSSDLLPRSALMYPLVSMDRPHLVHFLLADQSWDGIYNVSTVSIDDESRDDEINKVFSVSIDMSTKAVASILPYIEGERGLRGKDADMVDFRSHLFQPFSPLRVPQVLE